MSRVRALVTLPIVLALASPGESSTKPPMQQVARQEFGAYFRALIAQVVWERGLDLVVEDADASDTEAAVLDVNAEVPWYVGPTMRLSVLRRLPVLPPELEYCFVGRNPVLVDVLGNVVGDVLRESLPISERSVPG